MRTATFSAGSLAALAILFSISNGVSAETVTTVTTESDTTALLVDTAYKAVVPSPTNTWYGTRGLTQVSSAEGLGAGRLILGLQGAGWYRQTLHFPGVPNHGADIFNASGSIALGANNYVDVFAFLSGYGSNNYHSGDASGLGSVGGGVQASLPVPLGSPFRIAGQFAILNGLSDNPVDSNRADGYAYFQTRTQMDFMSRLIQTVTVGPEAVGFKVHANEALVTSLEKGRDPLMLLGAGTQLNLPFAVIGVELNSRTDAKDITFLSDPLWLTPSLQIRTNYNVNFTVGSDISLSKDRNGPAARALEPYRLFGGLALSFDTQAEKRRQEMLERRHAALEQIRLRDQAHADSLAVAQAQAQSDSIAAVAAAQAHQDSLALAQTQQSLQQERSRRSEMENQLLTTGMLMMDNVYFSTGKAEISINSKPYLNVIARMLTKYPKLQIEVGGHTDNVGSTAFNQLLSQQRADAVVAYMIGQEPSLNGRLFGKGYGEANPKSDNTTAEGRKLNRRTELQVLNKEALREYNPAA